MNPDPHRSESMQTDYGSGFSPTRFPGQRDELVPAASERPDQQPGDVGVELGTWRCLDQAAQLAFVMRGAEPAPVEQHVDVDAIPEGGRLAQRGEAWIGPRRHRVRGERGDEAIVVGVRGLGIDAHAGAALHLPGEART